MDSALEAYLENIRQVNIAIFPQLRPDMSGDEVLREIHEGAERVAVLRKQNDAILQEKVWNRRPETMTRTDVTELKNAAKTLLSNGKGLDVGAAYCIYRLLRQYAKLWHDRDLYIEECYNEGLSLFYLQGTTSMNIHGRQIYNCFLAGTAFLDEYDELDNAATRGFVIRCLGNLKLNNPDFLGEGDPYSKQSKADTFPAYQAVYDRAMAVLTSPQFRAKDPELPWDRFVLAMELGMTSQLDVLRGIDANHKTPHPEIAQAILHSAEYVYDYYTRRAAQTGGEIPLEVRYRYLAARYHARLGSPAEAARVLLEVSDQVDRTDYSNDGIFMNIQRPLLAQFYTEVASPAEQAELRPAMEREVDAIPRYILSFNSDHFTTDLAHKLVSIVDSGIEYTGYMENNVLNLLLYCHVPTFVHSRMVSELSAIFMDELCRRNPSALVGTLHVPTGAEAAARREELVQTARSCGLYHDLGKSKCMNDITIYSRKLLDEEFAFIKLHPVLGWQILKMFPSMEAEAEVALRHHITYDEKGGYYLGCPPCSPEYKMLVDIVSVADSTDAATDGVGRSYAQAKSLQQLVGELRAGSGTRYSPAVVALFDDEAFFHRIEDQLQSLRREIYGEAYLRAMEV